MAFRPLAYICAGLCLLSAGAALAGPSRPVIWTPEALAEAVERQASRTSFADLEQFGRDALAHRPPDQLRRLQHLAWIYLGESDYPRFSYWNARLRAVARQQKDPTYQAIADLNELRSRYDSGDAAAEAAIPAVAAHTPVWLVRSYAMTLQAYTLTLQDRPAEALRILADADHLVIAARAPWARMGVWDAEGLALMKLQDPNGAAIAFGRSQYEFSLPGYPRPDFDSIWNLAYLDAKLDRVQQAQALFRSEHRLAQTSNEASLKAWDAYLCATVTEAAGDFAGALHCLKPLGHSFTGARFLEARALPLRAIAEARRGRLGEARADLSRLLTLTRRGRAGTQSAAGRLDEVRAEILHLQGRDGTAFELLRREAHERELAQSKSFSDGVGQLTRLMAEQLSFRQSQLETARKNLALYHRLVVEQRVMGVAAALFSAFVLGALAWQWRVSRQLRRARLDAEAGSRSKSEFLANMSHEIRTPLNGLLTMADVIDRDHLPETQRERLTIVRQSGRDLLQLLNDILDFSKVEAGKLELEEVVFDVGEMLEAALAGFRSMAEAKGLRLSAEVTSQASGLRRGDPGRVRQVVRNLVSNGLKFTAEGQVSVKVSGLGAAGEEGLEIAVSDTGPGIADDKLRLLFQKFSQLDASTTRRFGGSGLGLAICQELAALMGGRVRVESTQGRGSTFTVTLMLPAADSLAALTVHQAVAVAVETDAVLRPLRILAAEDNVTNQLVLSTVLQTFGFELVLVENGAEAVETWRRQAFDTILMDVQMPVMDGVEATRTIRRLEAEAHRPRTPIIALSANAYAHQVRQYLEAGMDAHVSKPIRLEELQAALEQALSEPEPAGRLAQAS